jgi:hypothetical protein
METKETKARYKKLRITAKKYGGDDAYSWAVFVKGRPRMEGLGKSEVAYYKRQIANLEEEGRR